MASGWLFPSAWILFVPSPAIREYTGLAGTIISSLLYPVSQHADPGRYTGPTALRCRKYHYLTHFKSICHLWSMWNAANIPLLLLLRFLAFILSDRYFMAKLLVSHHNTVSQNMYLCILAIQFSIEYLSADEKILVQILFHLSLIHIWRCRRS